MKKLPENLDKLSRLLLEIKDLVRQFEEVERKKPNQEKDEKKQEKEKKEKAKKLLRIYSEVVTKLIQASDIVLTKSQVVTQRQQTLVKRLLRGIPEFHELLALFIALSDKTEEELKCLNIEDSVKEKLKPLIGNKKEIRAKETELRKKLKDIVVDLNMMT